MKKTVIIISGLMIVWNMVVAQSYNSNTYSDPALEKQMNDLYTAADMSKYDIDKNVLRDALKGYNLINPTKHILIIADLNKSSKEERLFVIDMDKQQVLFHSLVAHGKNSGGEYATSFSNKKGSLQSSLGFYITGQTITSPKHGYALILHGHEEGINHNAKERQIIVHSADYVSESFVKRNGMLGRSWGCPALPKHLNKHIIDVVQNGSVLYISGKDETYKQQSKYFK